MAKQLNINLGISADTSQAKKQLQDLQQALQNVAKLPGKATSLFDDRDIKQASKAAMELQFHLEKATNVNTGKLDLSRLSTSLKASNKDLNTYYNQLLKCGSEGQQAFLKLAQSISMAEAPVTRVNKQLAEMVTTLKNTARWQLSSSLLHGFMGTIQTATGYAQDLNSSLNDIRIVTSKSVEDMDAFAVSANKAAKALSTTTTAYTKASLIFYQQGLNDSQVQERTDVTIKMAQAAGESAEEVSSYMTAIWNNFDDGSKSLEYYGDVMAELGAKTAASSAEIAAGLEKFASIGETVGLSYEYATAAVATIVDKTRASADTVGTALKTIFARLQGLQLGETLEDGVDLNKYSKALQAVGVSVLDLNGNLRSADSIISDLGKTWDTLTNAQQTALAQTVAGTRQYAQLMSLMENFDAFEENVASAKGSTGTLQEQADIYAESWEAARDRVRAAAENIYDSLLDDKFFITILNGFEKLLTGVGGFIDGLGGMKGVLLTVGSVFMQYFAKSMPETLQNLRDNLMVVTGQSQKLMEKVQQKTKDKLTTMMMDPSTSSGYKTEAEGILKVLEMQQKLVKSSHLLTDQERQEYEMRIKNVQSMYKEVEALNEKAEAAQKAFNSKQKELGTAGTDNVKKVLNNYRQAEENRGSRADKLEQSKTELKNAEKGSAEYDIALAQVNVDTQKLEESILVAEQYNEQIQKIAENAKLDADEIDRLMNSTGDLSDIQQKINEVVQETTQSFGEQVKKYSQLESIQHGMEGQIDEWEKQTDAIKETENGTEELKKTMIKYAQSIKEVAEEQGVSITGVELLKEEFKDANLSVEDIIAKFKNFANEADTNLNKTLNKTNEEIERLDESLQSFGFDSESLREMRTRADEVAESTNNLKTAQENARESASEDPMGAFHMSEALTQAGATIMATYGMIEGVTSSLSILGDENASVMEKIGAGISLLTSLGSGFNAITSLSTVLLKSKTIAEWADNSAIMAKIVAYLGLEAAMAPVLVVTLAIMAALLALVGIVWIVVKAFEAVQAASPEGKLDAAKEKANQAAEAFDRVSQSVEETKNKLDELSNATDTLDGLTKGTEEWYEAVQKINTSVLELLDKYPELISMITKTQDGVLGLSEEGYQYILDAENTQLAAAQNIKFQADKEVLEAQRNLNYSNFKDESGDLLRNDLNKTTQYSTYTDSNGMAYSMPTTVYANQDEIKEGMQQLYDEWGDSLFTEAGAQAVTELLYDKQQYTEEEFNAIQENILNTLQANKEMFKENQQIASQIEALEDMQLESIAQSTGSTRSADQIRDLLGDSAYDDAKSQARQKVSDTFGDWNDHYNYDTSSDTSAEEWKMIEDFMKLKGEDTKYVAQRWGKMVLEVDGEEIEYSKDEVYDALAELYSSDELKANLTTQLQQTLGESLGGVDLSGLKLNDLNVLDSFKLGLEKSLEGTDLQDSVNDIFSSLYEVGGSTPEGFTNLIDSFSYLDFNNAETLREISKAAQELDAGTISAEQFAGALKEMNAQAQMDQMGSFFSSAAEGLGLDSEDAELMHEYAKNLMEIGEESEIFADSLASDADSAADLAVEIFRMNKGIDDLADGFEDWSDILKNSTKESVEYVEAMSGMKQSLADVLDVEADLISSDFVTEHLEEIGKAAEGDEAAIDSLRAAMDEEIILKITEGQTDAFKAEIQDLDATIQDLATNLPDIEIGAILQDEDFLEAANNLVSQAGMTADEANAYFAGIGYEPVYSTTEIDNSAQTPNVRTKTQVEAVGWEDATIDLPEWMGGPATIKLPSLTTITSSENLPPTQGDEVMRLTSFSGDSTPPQIKGMRKKATGSQSNYSSSNKGGKSPGSSGGSKKSGGGSKAPKNKTNFKKESKQYKKLEEESERYHEINEELDDLAKELDRVADAKDRAFGQDKLDNMAKEEALLKKQIKLEQQKQKEIKKNLELDKDKMDAWGASYDDNGDINNYDELVQSQVDAYNNAYNAYIDAKNAAVDAYNSSAKDETADAAYDAAIDAADATWDAAQEKYSEFQDDLAQYEETLDLFEESKDTLTEIQNQLYDLALEKVEYIVDLKINVAEDSLEYLEYLLENLDDGAYDAAESIALLGKQAEESMKKIDAYQDGLKGIFKNHGLSDEDFDKFVAGDEATMNKLAGMSFTEDEVNTIRNYKSALLEENRTLLELQDTVRGKVMEAFDELSGELDEQIDKLDHLSSITQSYQNIVDLVGQEYLGISDELMKTMDKTAMNVATDTLSATKDKLDALKESRASAQEALEEARSKGMDDTAKHWEDVIEEMDRDIMSAEEEFMGSWENALQVAADNFEKEITRAVDRFSEACGGAAGSLDKLQEAYDRQQEIDSRYLDDYKQIYELSKLTRSINASIDDTSNLNAKREYKELLEEIQAIEENGTKLSEYDLANLQRKFELKQAELALEEAKEAKSQVRMTQDLEGNWGYVYTADEDAVANAEQNYEDKLYAMQVANDEYITELQQLIITAEQDCMEEIANLNINDFASKEEYYAACQEIANKYYDKIGYYMGEMGKALDNNKILYENDWTKYSEMTGYKISDNQNYVDSFNETALSTLTGFDTMEGFQQNFNDAIGAPGQPGTLLGDLDLAYAEWEKNVEEVMNEAGTSVEDFAGLMEDEAERINDQSDSIAEETEDMADDMADTMDDIIDDVQEWEETYGQEIQAMIDANNRLIESFNELLAKWSEVSNSGATDPQIDVGDSGGGGDDGGGGGGGDSGGGGNSGPSATEIATEAAEIIQGVHKGTIPQTASGWVPSAQSMGYSSSAISIARQAFNDSKDGDGYSYCYQKALQLVGSYDTGGYTGEWGPQGRLAFLHQKEIVLNARDTENLLAAVDMIRQISQTIDLNALSASQGLNSLLYAGTVKDHKETIEQEVTIHAEFPNATNHSEIEEAFNNIVNMASQYANRKL